MPAILISLLPVLAQLAPSLVGMIGGVGAEKVATRVTSVVQDLFGTTDPAEVRAQVEQDPAKADALRARLDSEAEQLKAELADIQNARATSAALAQARSPLAWAPAAVSALVVAGFIVMVGLLTTIRVDVNEVTGQVVLLLAGTFSAGFTQVLNYWLGSSLGSRDKTEQIVSLLHSVRIPPPKSRRT